MRLLALIVIALAACEEHGSSNGDAVPPVDDAMMAQPVGRPCESSLEPSDPTAIATPSLECPSRICMHIEGQPLDLCTAECATSADCAGVPESPCQRFSCELVIGVGPFACKRMCACADQVPPGGFPVGCD